MIKRILNILTLVQEIQLAKQCKIQEDILACTKLRAFDCRTKRTFSNRIFIAVRRRKLLLKSQTQRRINIFIQIHLRKRNNDHSVKLSKIYLVDSYGCMKKLYSAYLASNVEIITSWTLRPILQVRHDD